MSDFTSYKLVPINTFKKICQRRQQEEGGQCPSGGGGEGTTTTDPLPPPLAVRPGEGRPGPDKISWPVSDPFVHPNLYNLPYPLFYALTFFDQINKIGQFSWQEMFTSISEVSAKRKPGQVENI